MNGIVPPPREPGVYSLGYEEYRASHGISKSSLDLLHDAPALIEWSRCAPVDKEAETAVNIGAAFHALLLEPDEFQTRYTAIFTAPKGCILTVEDLKAALTTRGIDFKAAASKQALIKTLLDADPNAPVADAMAAEWEKGIKGRTVLSATDWHKLHLMRGSVMAHPTARKMIEARGDIERCHYWIDEPTGELCRARLDKTIPAHNVILDVKTTADIDKMSRSIMEYRYHVQDAFYSDGYAATTAPDPTFLFLFVSTTRDRARYPVRVKSIEPMSRQIGVNEYRADLNVYARCRKTGMWGGIEAASLPDWYIAKQAA